MIRSYTVAELEQMSGTTRRTISDYISKGVLTGPSHRGRGARYPQKDLDVLTVLPRIRTLMKKEYPTLKRVSAFLEQLSVRDLNKLAALSSEEAFVGEMRRLRVRNSLIGLVPYVAPERIDEVLRQLTPGQIRGIDAGRYQIGAVLDIEALFQAEQVQTDQGADGTVAGKVAAHQAAGVKDTAVKDMDATDPFWSVSWLNGHQEDSGDLGVLQPEHIGSIEETTRRIEQQMLATTPDLAALVADRGDTQSDLAAIVDGSQDDTSQTVEERLVEIASRLEKLESMLEKT